MNKLLSAILTALMLFSFSALIAQSFECGTSPQTQYDARERLFENRANAANQGTATSRDVTVYAPIKFHIVSKTDGTLGIKESDILGILCGLNNYYADQDIIFYINYPFSYINNTVLYNDPGSPGGLFQIQQNWNNNSINVYITNSTGGSGGGYYLGPFPGFPYEHIVFIKGQLDGKTIAHEIGHFLSLAHPFYGWGQAGDSGWDPNIHGMQVGTWAPSVGLQNPVLNEKMDGSNCLQAADGICDTPPDYFFDASPLHDDDCTWNGGAMDPNGVVVETMENNVMNYFGGCNDYVFTDDQKEAIINDYNSSARAYIRHSYVPPTGDITEAPELIEPINGETTSGYNVVTFDWEEPADGAQRYILEIDQQATFAFLPKRYIIGNGTSTDIDGVFFPDVTYYWRVTPYNDGNTCNLPTSDVGTFKTGLDVSVKDIEAVNDWSIIPNPVRQNDLLNIQLEADKAFDADIRLFSMTGKMVKYVSQQQFNIGANNFEMNISGINTGMYIVAIQSEKGVINKKIVITE